MARPGMARRPRLAWSPRLTRSGHATLRNGWRARLPAVFLRADFEACIEAELNEDVFIRRLRKVLRKPEGKRSWAVLLIVLEPLPAFGNGRNLARRNPP